MILHALSSNVPVRLLGTRFKARNCISQPGLQEPYRDIFWEHPVDGVFQKNVHVWLLGTRFEAKNCIYYMDISETPCRNA
jgi:hypothetical protein